MTCGTRIIGQGVLVDRLLIALLADGHLLVEGVPGLAKTTAVKEMAARIDGDFHRVQFTPDLLPADLTGTEVYRPADGSFAFQRGPLFHNVLLADEVNRAPAKVQVRPARSDGGTSDYGRACHVSPSAAVPRHGDAEPDRAGRHLSPPGGAARPVSALRTDRLSGG